MPAPYAVLFSKKGFDRTEIRYNVAPVIFVIRPDKFLPLFSFFRELILSRIQPYMDEVHANRVVLGQAKFNALGAGNDRPIHMMHQPKNSLWSEVHGQNPE